MAAAGVDSPRQSAMLTEATKQGILAGNCARPRGQATVRPPALLGRGGRSSPRPVVCTARDGATPTSATAGPASAQGCTHTGHSGDNPPTEWGRWEATTRRAPPASPPPALPPPLPGAAPVAKPGIESLATWGPLKMAQGLHMARCTGSDMSARVPG